MKLKQIRYIYLLVVGLIVLNGCDEEQFLENGDGGYSREMTPLTITTHLPRALENDTRVEDDVQTLRVIAYEYNGANYLAQKANVHYTAAEASAGNGTYQIRIEIPHGIAVRVFVVANEQAPWNLGYPAMEANALKQKVIDHLEAKATLNIQPPFAMLGESETIESTDYRPQDIALVRSVAKVSLSLHAAFDQVVGLNGGNMSITSAALKRLPKTQTLAPGFSYAGNDESDFSSTAAKAFQFIPVVDGQSTVTGFTTEAAQKLVFYLPEYIISNKAYYSFIQINGQYTPLSSSVSIPITYRIPIGDGVKKLYEPSGVGSVDQLQTEDLTITRNTHYEFDATILKLGETDGILLYVQAQPWIEGETVEGSSSGAPYLNVSNIELTLPKDTTKRIYFWTNQPVNMVGIMPTLKDNNNRYMTLSDIFDTKVHFTNTTQTNGSIEIKAQTTASPGKYTIHLNAGGLVRDIQVTIQDISK